MEIKIMNESDKQSLVKNLLRLMTSYNHCFNNFSYIRTLNITRTQLKILVILNQHGEMTMSMLADYLSSSREQTTRAVSPLADKGYIQRMPNEENRRIMNVSLTLEGTEILKCLGRNYIMSFDKLPDEEIDKFISSLELIINTLDKISVK
jgi:DNA-binding MarR family transcriptional regulator